MKQPNSSHAFGDHSSLTSGLYLFPASFLNGQAKYAINQSRGTH